MSTVNGKSIFDNEIKINDIERQLYMIYLALDFLYSELRMETSFRKIYRQRRLPKV